MTCDKCGEQYESAVGSDWCANDIVSIRSNRETGIAIKEVKR